MGGAGAVAAGRFRRTPAERADQQLPWQRSGQEYFAAGTGAICRRNHLRPTHRFWADPRPRALAYVGGFEAPWQRDPRP